MPPNSPQMPMGTMQQPMGGPMQPGQIPPNMLGPKPKKRFNVWIVVVVILSLLLIGAGVFAFWSYSGMQDYKYNSDQKVEAAVEIAKQETATEKDKEFVEKEKNPYRKYQGPDTTGSVTFDYPKTWSAFITESADANNGTPLNGYLHPNFVPGLQSGTDFGLRFEVVNRAYNEVVQQYESKVKQGKVKIAPYKAPKVPSVLGVKIDGEINNGQQDSMVIVPLRDKTLQIWTESTQYNNDFNNIVLASLVFVP